MKTKIADINIDPTLCNKYTNEDQEFIFCTKGRPFGCLISPYLPTPTSTLIDYNLVRDAGMKMSDLQYTKLSFGGQKFRILGKISQTVQTIHGGLASGNFHFKASVVLDLMKNLDVESVAGKKLSQQLQKTDLNCSSSSSAPCLGASDLSSDSSTSTPKSSPRSTPRRSPPPQAAAPSPTPRPSSPPGFPVQPQYRDAVPKPKKPPKRPEIRVSMLTHLTNPTVRACNLHALEETFCNADIMPDVNKELRALHEADPDGRVSVNDDQIMTFVTTGGLQYEMGHGRNRCHPERCQERSQDTVPNNCGYNKQWLIPWGFTICGENCKGAFCLCVNDY